MEVELPAMNNSNLKDQKQDNSFFNNLYPKDNIFSIMN